MILLTKSLDTKNHAILLPAYMIRPTGSGHELVHMIQTNEIYDGKTKPTGTPKKICDLHIGLSHSITSALEEIIAREDMDETTRLRLWIEPIDRIWCIEWQDDEIDTHIGKTGDQLIVDDSTGS